jgi:hypothetical protein
MGANLISLATYIAILLSAGVTGTALFYTVLAGPLVALYIGFPVATLLVPPPLEPDRPRSLNLFGR